MAVVSSAPGRKTQRGRGGQRRVCDEPPVGTRRRFHLPAEVEERVIADSGRRGDRVLELAVRILVDLGDRGAGKDVVELVEEQPFPGGLDLGGRVGGAVQPGDDRKRLRLEEAVLGRAVERLHLGLGRQRAAVEFEVELAHPARQPRRGEGREELLDARHAEARQDRKILDPRVVLQLLLGRTAAAVAPAEGEQALGVAAFAPEVSPGAEGVERRHVAVVAVAGISERVRRDAAAVQPFPLK